MSPHPIFNGLTGLLVLGLALMGLAFWLGERSLRKKPLSAERQNDLANREYREFLASRGGGMLFGELHAAVRRIKDKYPLWDMDVSERPRQVEKV